MIILELGVLCSGLVARIRKTIDCMENMQRRATKIVYGFRNQKYEERLERVNLFSHQYRRMRGDMIETYKIISCLEDVNSFRSFTMSNMNNLRGYSLKLHRNTSAK